MGFSSARNLGRDISAGFSPPRRMPISEAVKKFMRVPKGAGNSVCSGQVILATVLQ